MLSVGFCPRTLVVNKNWNCVVYFEIQDLSNCAFQSNVIEAAPNMQRESEKEWYYGNADKERLGPYSFEEVEAQELMSRC